MVDFLKKIVELQEKFSTSSGKVYDFIKENLTMHTEKLNDFYKKMWRFLLKNLWSLQKYLMI